MKELQKDGRPYRTAYEAEQSAIRAYTNGILRGTDPLVAQEENIYRPRQLSLEEPNEGIEPMKSLEAPPDKPIAWHDKDLSDF